MTLFMASPMGLPLLYTIIYLSIWLPLAANAQSPPDPLGRPFAHPCNPAVDTEVPCSDVPYPNLCCKSVSCTIDTSTGNKRYVCDEIIIPQPNDGISGTLPSYTPSFSPVSPSVPVLPESRTTLSPSPQPEGNQKGVTTPVFPVPGGGEATPSPSPLPPPSGETLPAGPGPVITPSFSSNGIPATPLASVTNVPLPPVNPSPSPLVPGSGTGNGSSKGNSPGNSSNVTPFTGDASLHSPFRGIASTLGLGIMIAAAMLVL